MEIVVANKSHTKYAQLICDTIEESAKVRGTGIAKRTPEYIISKLEKNHANRTHIRTHKYWNLSSWSCSLLEGRLKMKNNSTHIYIYNLVDIGWIQCFCHMEKP